MANKPDTISQANIITAVIVILIIVLIGLGLWWLWTYLNKPTTTTPIANRTIPNGLNGGRDSSILNNNGSGWTNNYSQPDLVPHSAGQQGTFPQVQGTRAAPAFTLYNFSRPNCPHCRNFEPTWRELVNSLGNNPNIQTQYVDVSRPENEDLAFYYNISGVPTIILVTPTYTIEYEGNRSLADLQNFVASHMAASNGANTN